MVDTETFINSYYTNPNDICIFFFIIFIVFLIYQIENILIQYISLVLVIYFFMSSKNAIFYSNIIFFLINWNKFNYITWTKYYMISAFLISAILILTDKMNNDNDIFFISQTILNIIFFSMNLYLVSFYKEGVTEGKEILLSSLIDKDISFNNYKKNHINDSKNYKNSNNSNDSKNYKNSNNSNNSDNSNNSNNNILTNKMIQFALNKDNHTHIHNNKSEINFRLLN